MLGLVAIAPPLPRQGAPTPTSGEASSARNDDPDAFRYVPDAEAFSLDLDPRQVRFDLLEGWDREQEAYADSGALAFVSGPMYERFGAEGSANTVPLGDLKLGDRLWRGPNRSAARQRAFVGIRRDGQVEFGFGELTPERAQEFDTFIGGLHSVYNDLTPEPSGYKGAYSISMGQQIRYFLPRIRVLYGLRPDGRLAILMSRDGLTLEQTKALARERGFLAAYMPDHASKSRFIIPGVKGFSTEDANWISGGATSFVHVPYMLRLSRRPQPLSGNLLAGLSPQLSRVGCRDPLSCGGQLVGGVADRVLAGFNRLMEQGVEPLARLIWAPQLRPAAGQKEQKAPLREPVITADPQLVQERQQRDLDRRSATPEPSPPAPVLPDPGAPGPTALREPGGTGTSSSGAEAPEGTGDARENSTPASSETAAPAAAAPASPPTDTTSPGAASNPASPPANPAGSGSQAGGSGPAPSLPPTPPPPLPAQASLRPAPPAPVRASLPVAPPPPLSPPPPLP